MTGSQGNSEQTQWPQFDWDVCPPQKAGVDPDALLEADGEIRTRYKRINALLLVRHKQIVFERYYNGYSQDAGRGIRQHPPWRPDRHVPYRGCWGGLSGNTELSSYDPDYVFEGARELLRL